MKYAPNSDCGAYRNSRPTFLATLVIATGAILTLLAVPVALADLTVVSTVSVVQTVPAAEGRRPSATPGVQVTTYSHGKEARTEVDGGPTAIFDGNDVYMLDNQAKTYYKEPLKTWAGVEQPLLAPVVSPVASSFIDVDSDVDLESTGDNPADSQTQIGLPVKKYQVSGWINASPKDTDGGSQTGGPSGDHGGGGGGAGISLPIAYPQQNGAESLLKTAQYGKHPQGGEQRIAVPGKIRSTTVSGEIWLAKSVSFAGGKNNSAWAEAIVSTWGLGRLTSGLASKIAKEQALPTSAQIAFSWTDPQTSPNNNSEGFLESGSQTTITTTVQVKSIAETPVDPTLFIVPTTYTQIPPP